MLAYSRSDLADVGPDYYSKIYDMLVDEIAPEHMRIIEPRRYSVPGGYKSLKQLVVSLYSHVFLGYMTRPGDQASYVGNMVAYNLVDYDVPIYFVDEHFVRALAATSLPEGVKVKDIAWPLPALCFALPLQFTRECLGRDVGFVSLTRADAGDHFCKKYPPAIKVTNSHSQACVFTTLFDPEGGPTDYFAVLSNEDYVDRNDFQYMDFSSFAGPFKREPEEKEKDDQKFITNLSSLVVKLLMAMMVRPAVVVRGHAKKKIHCGNGKIEMWDPHWIGRGYRIIRQQATGTPEGTHASPRLHFRPGHYAHQFIGKRGDPGFVPVSSLPRTADGKIDWPGVPEDVRQRFWNNHKHILIDAVLINADVKTV